MSNHFQVYRPLIGGIMVANPQVGKPGTIGFFGTSDGQDRWLVSCYHVLGRFDRVLLGGDEPIYQNFNDDPSKHIADVKPSRVDINLDCAAALIRKDVLCENRILGIGKIKGIAQPKVGDAVVKAGINSGVTEGIIVSIEADKIVVSSPTEFPNKYDLSEAGDSGALWVMLDTHEAVGLHYAGTISGRETAWVRPIQNILTALQLKLP